MSDEEGSISGTAEPRRVWRESDDAMEQRLAGKLHLMDDSPTVARPEPIVELVANMARSTDPDLTESQVGRAATAGAKLMEVRDDPEQFVAAVMSVVVKYERGLAKARASGAPEPIKPTFADVETTQRFSELMKEEVKACRDRLFDLAAVRLPFKTLAEALAWLSCEERTNALAGPEYQALERQARALDSGVLRVKAEARYVRLQERDDEPLPALGDGLSSADLSGLAKLLMRPRSIFLAGRSAPLRLLSDVQRRLSEQAGVDEWEVTRFILLGVPPAVRPWRPRVPDASLLLGHGMPLWFSVEIRDSALSFAELGELFDILRREGLLMSARLRNERRRQKELLDFNRTRRDLVKPVRLVRDVVADWNAAHPGGPHYTPNSWLKALRKAREAFGEPKPGRVRGRRSAKAAEQGAPQTGQRTVRSEAVHPLVAMANEAELALAGDRAARDAEVELLRRASGEGAAEALRARFEFDTEIEELVAKAQSGDSAAGEEAYMRVLEVRGYWSAEQLRRRLPQTHGPGDKPAGGSK